jgi:hypothetical protein
MTPAAGPQPAHAPNGGIARGWHPVSLTLCDRFRSEDAGPAGACWTRHDIDEVHGHLHRHWEDWNTYLSAVAVSEDAQAFVTASLAQLLPEIAAWAATLPAGILTLKPWLVPVRAVR